MAPQIRLSFCQITGFLFISVTISTFFMHSDV